MSALAFAAGGVGLVTALFPASLILASVQDHPLDLSVRRVTAPVAVCDIDMNVAKGDVRRLSWAPNGESIHLQTQDSRSGSVFDYIIDLANGEISLAFGEPVWESTPGREADCVPFSPFSLA